MQGITTKEEAIEFLHKNARPVPPGLKFKVDRFRPEDARGVVECCYSIYGAGYPVDTYYIPEKLIREHGNGNIHGVVARTESGDVVGYGAFYRSAPPFAGIYEGGQLIVRKEYRLTRAAFEIHEFATKKLAFEVGMDAYFGEAVCKHLVVQKMERRSGSIETGIELDLMPEEAYESEGDQARRVSAVLMFKVLKDRPHDIYLPEIYFGPVNGCIDEMRLSRTIKKVEPGSASGNSLSAQLYFEGASVARLTLSRIGRDAGATVADFESTAASKGCKVRQAFICIGDPDTGEAFEALRSRGYFFGGYLPRWFDSDGMLLQKLVEPLNIESMQLYSDWAKELLEFVLKDRERTSPKT